MRTNLFDFFDYPPKEMKSNVDEFYKSNYQSFLLTTPYCSAYAFYKKFSADKIKGNFGDNCISLSIIAKNKFCDPANKFLYLVSGRHRPLIYQDNKTGNIIFIDPYLLHKEPIILNDIFLNPGKAYKYSVFPESSENYMQLVYEPEQNSLKQLKRISNNEIFFDYDLRNVTELDPDPYEKRLLYHNEQDNLSIRILDPSFKYTVHLVCALKPCVIQYKMGVKVNYNFYTISNRNISPQSLNSFDNDLFALEKIIGLPKKDIIHFMEKSVNLYLENMPHLLSYERESHYNPSNL